MPRKKGRKYASTASAAKDTEGKTEAIINGTETLAISSVNADLIKLCRLCETKDGPFLNIFDSEQISSKKIEELMPFMIAESDGLPHKICFRCSAKVEELHEFIQKCVKSQHNMHSNMGTKVALFTNTKERVAWEEKLSKCTLPNDKLYDDLIKTAMEGIEYVPLNPKRLEDQVIQTAKKVITEPEKLDTKNVEHKVEDSSGNEIVLKNLRLTIEKVDQKVPIVHNSVEISEDKDKSNINSKPQKDCKSKTNDLKKQEENEIIIDNDTDKIKDVNSNKSDNVDKQEPPFNIMDHVFKLKVNGVGTLFQCKLCNKNFLKIEVLESHGCAINGIPKIDFAKHIPPPQIPKPPSIKYIKIDGKLKKNKDGVVDSTSKPEELKKTEKEEVKLAQPTSNLPLPPPNVPPPPPNLPPPIPILPPPPLNLPPPPPNLPPPPPNLPPPPPNLPPLKSKPKIGPASRVKRQPCSETAKGCESPSFANSLNSPLMQTKQPAMNMEVPPVHQAPPVFPVVTFPTMPKVNSRYSFVPGPNNTFTLVEEQSNVATPINVTMHPNIPAPSIVSTPSIVPMPNIGSTTIASNPSNVATARREPIRQPVEKKYTPGPKSKKRQRTPSPEIIELDDDPPPDQPPNQPYPVGLFKTTNTVSQSPPVNVLPAFATPAMKKQLYTVVQTGNPSKLLISSKPMPVEEPPKKRMKRSKHDIRENNEPFKVTIEDTTPAKNPDTFTFINVDPLLQPSYVLPTDSIQESQISTSSQVLTADKKEKDSSNKKYSCNMCSERFSREKKLLTHIQSHYTQMDEEDLLREKIKKRKMKS